MRSKYDRNANPSERFFSRVEPDENGCLIWTGATSTSGYARFSVNGRLVQVHRWLLERALGEPIDPALDVDHLCRNRACVRPAHLEIVTRAENLRRSPLVGKVGLTKTHCPQGHAYDDENTYWYRGHRHCKACARDRRIAVPLEIKAAYSRAFRARQKAKEASA